MGETHIRFWNVVLRIVKGVKSVGKEGEGKRAVPAGICCAGV
jgi:hypothetical protein